MLRLRSWTLTASAVCLTLACADNPVATPPETLTAEASAAARGPAATARFLVSVTNLTASQAFTPPIVAAHRRPVDVFQVGEPASLGVQQIAENGNLAPLHTALGADRHVADVVIALGDPPPLLPGETRAFEIDAERGAQYLSWVSMLICTNDGFTGVSGAGLPSRVGQSETWYTAAYDAGTEINTEAAEDLVPPCGLLTGIHDGSIGTGMSNPALAENGVIHHHPGIGGDGDLTVGVHGWNDPVARIVVERIH